MEKQMTFAVSNLEVLIAIAVVINTCLQAYDILWCRWHNCGTSSKNSTKKPTLIFPKDS